MGASLRLAWTRFASNQFAAVVEVERHNPAAVMLLPRRFSEHGRPLFDAASRPPRHSPPIALDAQFARTAGKRPSSARAAEALHISQASPGAQRHEHARETTHSGCPPHRCGSNRQTRRRCGGQPRAGRSASNATAKPRMKIFEASPLMKEQLRGH